MDVIFEADKRNLSTIGHGGSKGNETIGTQFSTKRVNMIQLSYSTTTDIRNGYNILIDKYQAQNEKGDPLTGGVNSLTLGTSQYKYDCSTCQKDAVKCQGHNGYMVFNKPVIHPLRGEDLIQKLNNICLNCNIIEKDKTKTWCGLCKKPRNKYGDD